MAELDYKEFVARMLVRSQDEPDGVVFKNSTPEHARIAMDAIIGNSRRNLKLMARALHRDIHDPNQLLSALKDSDALQLQVIVEIDNPFDASSDSALSVLAKELELRKRVEVRKLQGSTPIHLAVGDGVFARIEEDQAARRAIIAFNNKAIACKATKRFEEIWPQCQALPWPGTSGAAPPS